MAETAPVANPYREYLDKLFRQESARQIPPPSLDGSRRDDEQRAYQRATARGLPPSKWDKTFDMFDLSLAPAMRDALNAVKRLISTSPTFQQLMLMGPYGTGKTHLAYAACNHCRERNWPYRFIKATDLMKSLRSAISNPDLSPEELIGAYTGNFLLVVDDFGAHQDTDYAAASMYAILDARYELKHATILTTNCAIERIDPRIASRFSAGIVPCAGADQRMRFDA